eukprot:5918177-Prymnesium_polylepis.1
MRSSLHPHSTLHGRSDMNVAIRAQLHTSGTRNGTASTANGPGAGGPQPAKPDAGRRRRSPCRSRAPRAARIGRTAHGPRAAARRKI